MGITASIDISAEQRQFILALLNKHLPKTQIWAFGSRVKWTTRSNSDLDLVAFASPQQEPQISALKEAFEESNLPFRVDLLVWENLPENFHRNIQECYVVLVLANGLVRGGVMSSEFVHCTVEEIALEMGDAPFGSNLKNSDYTESGALVVQGKNIQGRLFDWGDQRHVSIEKYKSIPRSHCYPGDLIFPKVGTIGKVGILSPCEGFDKYILSTNTMRLKVDPKKANPFFIYYYFTWSRTVNLIHAMNSKSVQPVFNFTSLKKFPLELPSLEIQNEVGRIISDLDNKIELNRQTNQTLEQIAQALFKSWFVDFEPVKAKMAAKQAGASAEQIEQAAICTISGKTPEQLAQLDPQTLQQLKTTAALFPDALVDSELGEIPEGWPITVLGELLEFNPKRTLKSGTLAPYLDMKNVSTQGHLADEVLLREMASGTKFINGDTLLARITPCLENGKTAYVDFLEKGQVGWGSTEYIVMRPRNGRPTSLGYMIARLDAFRAKAIQTMTGTSGRQRVSSQALAEQTWIDYPIELLNIYDLVAGRYLDKAKINGDENKVLSELRDSLLTKLLSGELSVNPESPALQGRRLG